MTKISIIGSGTVGTIIGSGFSEVGYSVTFYDIDQKKLDLLRSKGYSVTNDLKYIVLNTDVSFICVPTPLSEERSPRGYRKMNLSYIENVTKNISSLLKEKGNYHTLAIKSTVLPNTAEKLVIPILKNTIEQTDKKVGVCVNPEFLTEITGTWTKNEQFIKNFFNEDRYVIGEQYQNSESGDILEELYKEVNKYSGNKAPIERVSLSEAAWIKLMANAALACKISYFNDLFEAAKKFGI
ncbi:MAG: 2-dehydropantoate 2-reductase N-terminal domain-containing protein, partial [Candidatus Aenigmatarchaeota archaeon]